jgi:hypothetical protein
MPGIPYPDPKTMCRGRCEGTGILLISPRSQFWGRQSPEAKRRWRDLHRKALVRTFGLHALRCNGYHFVECERCKGTGKEPGKERA